MVHQKQSSAGKGKERPVDTAKAEIDSMKRRLIVSFLFSVPLFYISMGHMMGWPLPEQTKAYEGLVAMRKAALAALLHSLSQRLCRAFPEGARICSV